MNYDMHGTSLRPDYGDKANETMVPDFEAYTVEGN